MRLSICAETVQKAALISKPGFWSQGLGKNVPNLISSSTFPCRRVGERRQWWWRWGVDLWGVRDGLPGFHGSGSYTKAHSLARRWLQGWITLNRSDAISTVQCNTKLNTQASGSIALSAAFLIIFFRDSVSQPNSNNGALAGQKLRSRRRFKMSPLAHALPLSPERSAGDLEGRRRGEGELSALMTDSWTLQKWTGVVLAHWVSVATLGERKFIPASP